MPRVVLPLLLTACAVHSMVNPSVNLTPPARLCGDRSLGPKDFCLPAERIEALLRKGAIDVEHARRLRHGHGGVSVVYVTFPDEDVTIRVKWKPAARDGESINNSPRRELAAYQLQKLFLTPDEYVVPPGVGRCMPAEVHKNELGFEPRTFEGTECVFGLVSYWVENVTDEEVFDRSRMRRDPAYLRTVGQMNLLTYLVHHGDPKAANFLISKDDDRPRAFSVDNGLAFSGLRSPAVWLAPRRDWGRLRVPSLPRTQIDRLRKLTRKDLDRLLVVAQYRISGGQMDEVPAGAPFDPDRGVRRAGAVVQLGLTISEVDGVEHRLEELLAQVGRGEVKVQ